MKTFDFTASTVREIYPLLISTIVPRPIAWVTSRYATDGVNLAPFSFFTGVSSDPPCLVFSVTRKRDASKKDTLRNIELHKEFVVHIASANLAALVNETSAELDYGDSEVTKNGLTLVPSIKIKTPRIQEASIAMECVLEKLIPVGEEKVGASTLVLGRILMLHADDSVLTENQIDIQKLDPLARLGGIQYGKTREVFEISRPSRS